jgi:hypothetical protein
MDRIDTLTVFRLALASLPLAFYMGFLALAHSRRHPMILALCVDWNSFPERWPLFAAAGVLGLMLAGLLGPREYACWVFYNAAAADVERTLIGALDALGEPWRRNGDLLDVADGRLRLSVSDNTFFSNVTVYHETADGELAARLEADLADRVRGLAPAAPLAGLPYIFGLFALLGWAAFLVMSRWRDLRDLFGGG